MFSHWFGTKKVASSAVSFIRLSHRTEIYFCVCIRYRCRLIRSTAKLKLPISLFCLNYRSGSRSRRCLTQPHFAHHNGFLKITLKMRCVVKGDIVVLYVKYV